MKVLMRTGALLLAAAMMTGCLTQTFQTKVNPDGSGTNVLEIGFEKRFLRMMEQMGGEEGGAPDMFGDLESAVEGLPEEWAATAEQFEDNRYKGVRIRTAFADLEMLQEQLNTLMERAQPTPPGEEGAEMGEQQPLIRDVVITRDDEGNVSISATAGGEMPEEMDPAQLEMMQRMFGEMRMGWTIELPTLTSFSPEEGAVRTGNSVRFNFQIGRSYEIRVQGTLTPTSGGSSSEVTPEEPVEPEQPEGPSQPVEPEETEEDRQLDNEQLESYLAGTWRFDLDSLRSLFAEQEMPEEFIEMILEQFASARITFGDGMMRMSGSPQGEQTNRYKITNRGDRTLTLQNEDGNDLVVTFHSRNRIAIQSDDMPGALTLLRVRD